MANRNSRSKAAVFAKELAQKKKGNADFRLVPPPRKNQQKDFGTYTHFSGFRKPERQAVAA